MLGLDIFVSDTTIARNFHLSGLENKNSSYKTKELKMFLFHTYVKNRTPHTLFLEQRYRCYSKNFWQFEIQDFIAEVKIICIDQRLRKNYCILGTIQAKQGTGWHGVVCSKL